MPKFDLVSAMEIRKRELLIELLRQHPELTLGDLHQLARGELGPMLRAINIADLRGSGPSQSAPPGSAPRRARPGHTTTEASSEVNTRSAAGREAFDKKILQAVTAAGGPISATQVQAHVGGANAQVRAGLNRLIEAGQLTWSGRARGTRYHLA